MATKKTKTLKIQIPEGDRADLAALFIPEFAAVARTKLAAILDANAHPTLTDDDREVFDIVRASLNTAITARLRGDR